MKRVTLCFFGLSFYLFNCSIPIAQETLQPLKLLTSPSPVFSEIQNDGRVSGYSVEYARCVFHMAGYNPTVTPLPFARLLKQLNENELVVTTGLVRTPEREDDFYWIAPMSANVIAIFSLQDEPLNPDAKNTDYLNDVKLGRLDKLKSVAVLRGDYRADILRQHGVKNIVEFNSWEQALKAVLKGRVSSVFVSELGVSVTCKSAGFDCKSLKKIYTHDIRFSYLAMLKTDKNREHALKLANAAEQFIKTRIFSQLVDQWLPKLQLLEANTNVT